jgi:hypothetical protein
MFNATFNNSLAISFQVSLFIGGGNKIILKKNTDLS